MIASTRFNYVYPCPPKTGTLSFRTLFQEHYAGQVIAGYHQVVIPGERDGALVFISTRHPYTRLWSWYQWELYQLRIDRPGRWKQYENRIDTFFDFLKILIDRRGKEPEKKTSAQLYLTQYDYYVQSGASMYLRLENAIEDLAKIPFVTMEKAKTLKHRRETPGKAPLGLTAKDREAIRYYCPEDFDFFGYAREGGF
jgi:hypothetical protein